MIDNSGPAFPFVEGLAGYKENKKGMTLRDYFAGQALAGICANPDTSGAYKLIVNEAYAYADAMLVERNKE
jgi:hypothetical protein